MKNLIILTLLCCYAISDGLSDPLNDLIDTANEIEGKETSQNDQKSKIKSRDFQPGFNNIVDSFKKPLGGKGFGNINQMVSGQKKSAKQLKQTNFQNNGTNENQLIALFQKILISFRNLLATVFSKIFIFLIESAKKLLKSFNTQTFDFNFFS